MLFRLCFLPNKRWVTGPLAPTSLNSNLVTPNNFQGATKRAPAPPEVRPKPPLQFWIFTTTQRCFCCPARSSLLMCVGQAVYPGSSSLLWESCGRLRSRVQLGTFAKSLWGHILQVRRVLKYWEQSSHLHWTYAVYTNAAAAGIIYLH